MIYNYRDPDTVVLIPVTDTEDSEPQFIPPPAPPSLIHSRYFINFMFYILSIFCFSDEILAEIQKLSPLTSTRLSSGDEPRQKRIRLDYSKPPPKYNPDDVMECHYEFSPPKNSVSVPITFPEGIDKGDHTVSRNSTLMESTREQHEDEKMAEQNEDAETTLVQNDSPANLAEYKDYESDEDNEGNENEGKLEIDENNRPNK